MAIKRKKNKHKKRMRSSTRLTIFIVCFALILISIIGLYSNIYIAETEEREETVYKHLNKYAQTYTIELKQNKYMGEEHLLENELFVTDLIEKLKLNYNYTYEGLEPEKINCTYNVKGKLKSTYSSNGNEQEMWNREYVILESKDTSSDTSVLEINENIDIDLSEYNKLVNDFIEKMQMAISTKLHIIFEANVTAYANGEMFLNKYTNEIEVTLGDKVTKITGEKEDSREEKVKRTVQITKEKNEGVIILSAITLVLSAGIMIKVQRETKTSNRITNLFKIELNEILSTCGDRIVKIDSETNTAGSAIIELKDINELVKLSEELYKPILYYKVPNKKEAWFSVSLENEVYRYILK